jgi:hypothetical protein
MAGAGEMISRTFVGLMLSLFASVSMSAQTARQAVQPELRGDVIVSRWTAVQGGLGVSFPAGLYVRTGGVIAAGGGGKGFDSRLDLISRFTLDPFRESRWGFYAGGGVSSRYVERDSPRGHAYLLVFAGIEGPLANASVSGWAPAIEVGLGGGARVAVILRQGIRGRR